jgi:hypothetical protein
MRHLNITLGNAILAMTSRLLHVPGQRRDRPGAPKACALERLSRELPKMMIFSARLPIPARLPRSGPMQHARERP